MVPGSKDPDQGPSAPPKFVALFDEEVILPSARGPQTVCRVTVFDAPLSPKPTVVLTELESNPGRSVTNAAEDVAAHVFQTILTKIPKYSGLDPKNVDWVEHYDRGGGTHSFETISFDVVQDRGWAPVPVRYKNPRWCPWGPTPEPFSRQ